MQWGLLLLFTSVALIAAAQLSHFYGHDNQPTIAGLDVPAVHCQEDEVIGWLSVDTLGCINYEEVN